MARGNRPAKRLVRTLIARERGAGRTTARRKGMTTGGSSVSVPDKVNWVIIKNVGGNPVAFNFNADGGTNFWSLEMGEQSPPIGLGNGVTINARSLTGPSTIECLFY